MITMATGGNGHHLKHLRCWGVNLVAKKYIILLSISTKNTGVHEQHVWMFDGIRILRHFHCWNGCYVTSVSQHKTIYLALKQGL